MKSDTRLRISVLAFVLLVSLLLVSIAYAASVVIDTFDDANQQVEATALDPVVDGFATGSPLSILGAERDIHVEHIAGSTVRVLAGPQEGNVLTFSLGNSNLGTATIVYDGVDGSATLDPDGLCPNPPAGCSPNEGSDLTGGGTNDGLHFEVVFNNATMPVEFRVYSGSLADYSYYQLPLPGSIALGSHVDFMVPFSQFTDVGNGADFTNVGAFELFLDGSESAGAKINLDFFAADSDRDFGDAPQSYGTVSHVPFGLRLGANIDGEPSQLYSVNARGDDNDQAPGDEDGVTRTAGVNWSIAGGGSVDVILNNCAAPPCYLSGWADWNKDGQFGAGEQIFDDQPLLSDGSHTLPFAINGTPAFDTSYYLRFRLCNSTGACNTPTGSASSGEVEDYLYAFGPNAITLSNFMAQSGSISQSILVLVIVVAGLLGAVMVYVWVRRHQKA